MHRVNKRFQASGKQYEIGEVDDFTGVRNLTRLLSQQFLTVFTAVYHTCEVCERKFDTYAFESHKEAHPQKKKKGAGPT